MSGKLLREVKQTRPFSSPEEEAALNVHRTAALLDEAWAAAFRERELTATQYNVLRILRGAGSGGLPCGEIAARMVRRDPDVTRLLDRLAARGLLSRSRSAGDRRVVLAHIAPAGLLLLDGLEGPVRDLPKRLFGHLGRKRLGLLIDLLEEARTPPAEEGTGKPRPSRKG
jgi:DNA-binding MarR family transcriptional regulator